MYAIIIVLCVIINYDSVIFQVALKSGIFAFESHNQILEFWRMVAFSLITETYYPKFSPLNDAGPQQ